MAKKGGLPGWIEGSKLERSRPWSVVGQRLRSSIDPRLMPRRRCPRGSCARARTAPGTIVPSSSPMQGPSSMPPRPASHLPAGRCPFRGRGRVAGGDTGGSRDRPRAGAHRRCGRGSASRRSVRPDRARVASRSPDRQRAMVGCRSFSARLSAGLTRRRAGTLRRTPLRRFRAPP